MEKGFKLFFLESICDDLNIIESNIKEVKVTSPDYADAFNKVVEVDGDDDKRCLGRGSG